MSEGVERIIPTLLYLTILRWMQLSIAHLIIFYDMFRSYARGKLRCELDLFLGISNNSCYLYIWAGVSTIGFGTRAAYARVVGTMS